MLIHCQICGKTTSFGSFEIKPHECSFCFSALDETAQISEDLATSKPEKLRFTCCKSGNSFDCPATDGALLGRAHFGADIFNTFTDKQKPIISRQHASLRLVESTVFLSDENSLNGTFVGELKISCALAPQKLTDKMLVFFGKEPFNVTFLYAENQDDKQKEVSDAPEIVSEKPLLYICNNCGITVQGLPVNRLCPTCSSFNSFSEK